MSRFYLELCGIAKSNRRRGVDHGKHDINNQLQGGYFTTEKRDAGSIETGQACEFRIQGGNCRDGQLVTVSDRTEG